MAKENLKLDYEFELQPNIGKDVVKVNVLQPNLIIMLYVEGGGLIFLRKGESYITDKPKIMKLDKFVFKNKTEMFEKVNQMLTVLQT